MDKPLQYGIRQNARQFTLLVLVNAFVGAMLGLERAVLPGFGQEKFGLQTQVVLLSFIAAFGLAKAISNYSAGRLAAFLNRKQLLILGWLFALPVPFLLMYGGSWTWVVVANVLLGINQGLAWSATIIMKIDIAGPKNRGLAMGINEFAGYLAVGLAAYLSGNIAAHYGYSFFPFIPGIVFAVAGLLLSVFFIRDTSSFVQAESRQSRIPVLKNTWASVTWKHQNIGTVTLNGFVNNMNDAVVWGLLPILLLQKGFPVTQIGFIAGLYPAVWGILQLVTGSMGDKYCKKQMITIGMLMQAAGIMLFAVSPGFGWLVLSSVLLGAGTAMVYPNFFTVIAENTHPGQRAATVSIFRFWRDSGYVAGALFAGLVADQAGGEVTLLAMAALTALAGLAAHFRMCCTLKKLYRSEECIPQPA